MLIMLLSGCTNQIKQEVNTQKQETPPVITLPEQEYIEENITQNINQIIIIEENETPKDSWYKPKPGISWQWQLAGKINTQYNVDLYSIDLVEASQEVINELHNKGIKVICYFSAGSLENYRKDAKDFPKEVIGKTLHDWPNEKWLDISSYEKFAGIMEKRLDLAVQKKCDGVEPDNIDGYKKDTGFRITYQDQLKYNKWLAKEAHNRNLSIALKNDLGQINDLVDYFDFAINEQCFQYDECDLLLPFIKEGKAVLGVEYELEVNEFCREANNMDFSWLKMDYYLNGRRISCR